MASLKIALKFVFALFFVVGGLMHFVKPDFYVAMMPDYLPLHLELVYVSGVAEVLLGVLLLIPKTQRLAAWGLILLLLAVFPANINMAVNADRFPDVPMFALLVRLPVQLFLIWWAWTYTRKPKDAP